MINNGVWLSKQSPVGTFLHINDQISHQNNLVSIYSNDKVPRPKSTGARRPNLVQLVGESIEDSINTHCYIADSNPQQVYLRSGSIFQKPQSAGQSRVFANKFERFKQRKTKIENDQLFDRMCSILARKNRHQSHADSQEYHLSLINPASRKVTETKRLYSENIRLLSTIKQSKSSYKDLKPIKIFRRPLAAEHNTLSVERYLVNKLKRYSGTFSAYCMDEVKN